MFCFFPLWSFRKGKNWFLSYGAFERNQKVSLHRVFESNSRKTQTLIDLNFLYFLSEMKRRTSDVRPRLHTCTASAHVQGVCTGALRGTNSVSIKIDLSPFPKTCLTRQKASALERIQNAILIVISRIPRFSLSSPPFSPPPPPSLSLAVLAQAARK